MYLRVKKQRHNKTYDYETTQILVLSKYHEIYIYSVAYFSLQQQQYSQITITIQWLYFHMAIRICNRWKQNLIERRFIGKKNVYSNTFYSSVIVYRMANCNLELISFGHFIYLLFQLFNSLFFYQPRRVGLSQHPSFFVSQQKSVILI